MIIKITVFVIFLIIALLGYLFYTEYRDNILFRGESFSESYGVKVILDYIVPKDTRVLDNRLFYVFGNTTVRDFYMVKILVFLCSIVVCVAVVTTNVLSNRLHVFTTPPGDLPYVISESEYEVLSLDLTFNTIDEEKDLYNLTRNMRSSSEYNRYLTTDTNLLYEAIESMSYALNNTFGVGEILVAIIILLLGWFLPNIILSLLFKLLKSDMSYEYAKLESYIYLNCDQRVETILVGLANEAVVYRELFKAFLLRYREDRFLSYSLILSNQGFTQEFKTLIEYLSLLENGTTQSVKSKITINRRNYMDKLKIDIRRSAKNKRDFLHSACLISVIIGLGGVLVTLIKSAL
ncbi:MAG: hypothetical protein ACLR3R_19515 [Clostridium paraputrificum]